MSEDKKASSEKKSTSEKKVDSKAEEKKVESKKASEKKVEEKKEKAPAAKDKKKQEAKKEDKPKAADKKKEEAKKDSEKKKPKAKSAKKSSASSKHYDTIVAPVITEKSQLGVEFNKVTFIVAPNSNKTSIKEAIEALFSVEVANVNVLNRKGKVKRFRGKIGKRKDKKQAIVTLKEGHTIDIESGLKG